MTQIRLGTIERIDPREIWKSEPYDFTPWLRENIGELGRALGLEIDVDVQQEVAVGLFSADLLGTDVGTSAGILVENQLAQTDHSHLGQVLTYAAGLGTDIVVWVSTKVRDEHRQALTWLNERTHEDVLFFGVEIEVLKIGDSLPAPHLSVVVAPNEWQKSKRGGTSGSSGAQPSERGEKYRRFWQGLLEEIQARDPSATTASPERAPRQNWFGISIGRTGFADNMVFGWSPESGNVIRVELYIDVGDQDQNKAIFDVLESDRVAIEGEFVEELEWTRRDDIRASRVLIGRPGSIDDSEEELHSHRVWGADRMLALKRVFAPRVKALPLPLPVDPGTADES